MDIVEAITSRRSVRGYKPDPVSKEVLKEILEVATRAPSQMNTQPWQITVIAGEVLEKIKQASLEKRKSGEASRPDIKIGVYSGEYRERQVALGIQLYQLLSIARDDTEKKTEWIRKGFRFFDAPAVVILSSDESLGESGLLGIGTIAQTIALAALNYGLGTCIQEVGLMYPDVIRKFTGLPESQRITTCLTIGYPDWDYPANNVHSEREPIENVATWCGL